MSDFANMMHQQGVAPMHKAAPPCKPITPTTRHGSNPVSRPSEAASHPSTAIDEDVRWFAGEMAKTALSNALTQTQQEAAAYGHRSAFFALGRREGRLDVFTVPRDPDASSLLGWADRNNIELIIIAGRGWKLIMHPKLGVASIAED